MEIKIVLFIGIHLSKRYVVVITVIEIEGGTPMHHDLKYL